MRLFGKFTQRFNDAVMDDLYRWLFGKIAIDGVTLDLDSTVMTRYGTQEGAARGYNPAKRGRASHHPLMAFVADLRMIANCWLRPGNSSSANNVQAFLTNTLHRLGDKRVCLLRADSGFSDSAFLDHLDTQPIHYIIALRQNQPLQRALVNAENWWLLIDEDGHPVPGIELTRFAYQPDAWSVPRWVVGIRQHTARRADPKGKTLNLFADDPVIGLWRFSALTTDLDLSAETVWRIYRGRADCENRIKELKYDFAADSFNMKGFWATEAAPNVVMLAYAPKEVLLGDNLISLFRQAVLRTKVQPTLATLHGQVLAIGASWHREADNNTLILSLPRKRRAWFKGLWTRSEDPPVIPVSA
jgi:hypothetical protein